MASRLQDVILRGTAAARPAAATVAPGTLYYSTDTATTDRSTGAAWETYADAASSPSSILIPKLAQPFIPEPEEHYYEPFIPGPAGPPGSQGIPGVVGLTGIVSPIPFFVEREVYEYEPPLPIPGAAGAAGSSALSTAQKTRQIGIVVDGGGAVPSTGVKGYKSFPVAGTITGVRLLADVVGSIVIDIWKDTYANYPPTVADTITAAAKPTISAAIKSEDITLTGWNTTVNAGDVFGFNIDSIATITRIILELTIVVS